MNAMIGWAVGILWWIVFHGVYYTVNLYYYVFMFWCLCKQLVRIWLYVTTWHKYYFHRNLRNKPKFSRSYPHIAEITYPCFTLTWILILDMMNCVLEHRIWMIYDCLFFFSQCVYKVKIIFCMIIDCQHKENNSQHAVSTCAHRHAMFGS
jgi:hypothetical protein